MTVRMVIRVSPIVSAAVVAATRCGLRRALAVASRLTGPVSRPGSQPRNAMAGGTISGPSASTATKHRQPPAAIPTKPEAPLTCPRPVTAARIPAPANTTAAATRSQPAVRLSGCSCWPPRAATGATRVADRAGATDAATVTVSPAAIAIATADGCSTTGPDGMDAPNAVNSRCSPQPRPTPASTPAAEAASPVITDSSRVLRNTWPRLAPTHRSRASSRPRWVMRMVKVL